MLMPEQPAKASMGPTTVSEAAGATLDRGAAIGREDHGRHDAAGLTR